MALDDNLGDMKTESISKERYLPFAAHYLENPEPIGQKYEISTFTSVTFCTWKCIPTVDDGD